MIKRLVTSWKRLWNNLFPKPATAQLTDQPVINLIQRGIDRKRLLSLYYQKKKSQNRRSIRR